MRSDCSHFSACILAIFCLLTVGCGQSSGPKIAAVDGVLMSEGKPLSNATVTFFPASGRPSTGTTNGEGKFTLDYTAKEKGAVVGMHTVQFSIGGSTPPPPPMGASSSKKARTTGTFGPPKLVDWKEEVAVKERGNHFIFEI